MMKFLSNAWAQFFRGQSGQTRVAVLLATVLLAMMPFWLAGSYSPLPGSLSNKALAASDATGREQALQGMSGSERVRYGRAVRDRLLKDTDSFLSMSGGDLALVLSVPALQRRDGVSQVWQYRSGVCVLDVFLQDDNVVHYEVRSPGKAVLRAASKSGKPSLPAGPDNSACLKALVSI